MYISSLLFNILFSSTASIALLMAPYDVVSFI